MEVTVSQVGSEVVVNRDLERAGSRWHGEIEVEAGEYIVALDAYKGVLVKWHGQTSVTVSAGVRTSATIQLALRELELEPNDSRASANPISFGTAYRGRLATNSDVDYFQLEITGDGILQVDFSSGGSRSGSKHYTISITNSGGSIVDGLNASTDDSKQLEARVAVGTYYIVVTFFTYRRDDPYEITASFTATFTEAQPINSPPVADAGTDLSRQVGDSIVLDGSGSSDSDGDDLTYRWRVVALGAGSHTRSILWSHLPRKAQKARLSMLKIRTACMGSGITSGFSNGITR
jgi:hypothetical protein